MSGIRHLRLHRVEALQVRAVIGWSESNAWIPVRVRTEPSERFGAHSFHGQLWHHVVELEAEVTDPAVGQNDVGIEDLAGHRMHAAWTNRGSNVIVEPTDEVVLYVFWIEIHRRW